MTDEPDLMDVLDALHGEGRVPVEDIGSPEDPRFRVRTPEGPVKINRPPDYARKEGSSRIRAWTVGKYRVTEDRDWQPGLKTNHAIYVE